jgi:hypothetical protein
MPGVAEAILGDPAWPRRCDVELHARGLKLLARPDVVDASLDGQSVRAQPEHVFARSEVDARSIRNARDSALQVSDDVMYGMLSVLAELQRELIVANTRDGLASARARGRVGGRKPKLTPEQAALAQQLYDAKEKTVQQIGDLFGVPRSTVYGYLTSSTASSTGPVSTPGESGTSAEPSLPTIAQRTRAGPCSAGRAATGSTRNPAATRPSAGSSSRTLRRQVGEGWRT